MRHWELQAFLHQLLDVWSPNIRRLLNFNDLENMNRPEAGAVARGHVEVERLHSVGTRHFAILLVHVVGSRARIIADPDAEVFHAGGPLFVDL